MENIVRHNGVASMGETTWSELGDFKRGVDGSLVVLDEKKLEDWVINRVALACEHFKNGRCMNKRISNGHIINDSKQSEFFCRSCSRD